eukprot:8017416-Ditylum_brightwellii.AAC.1
MERIDNKIAIILEEAEAKLTEISIFWWSDTLHYAYQIHVYWKQAMLFAWNHIEDNIVLKTRWKGIDPEVDIYQ